MRRFFFRLASNNLQTLPQSGFDKVVPFRDLLQNSCPQLLHNVKGRYFTCHHLKVIPSVSPNSDSPVEIDQLQKATRLVSRVNVRGETSSLGRWAADPGRTLTSCDGWWDIAAGSDLSDGIVPGDRLTGVCRFLRRLT